MATTSRLLTLQNASTADGNGVAIDVQDNLACQQIEIVESGGGTATIALQGSMDGTNFITGLGYQLVTNTTSPARSVVNISVLANTRKVYQILDPHVWIRAVQSATTGGAVVTIKAYIARAH